MSDLAFKIKIGAEDTGTGSVFRGALANVFSFARSAAKPIMIPIQIAKGGLGILRDINLGLAPVIRGIDNIIDRGSKLEVIRRGFQNLTGQSSKNIDIMARQIVRASAGTMRMAEAMALANRALGSMSFDDLLTAVEFISKKSVATGKDPGEALGTVITGLVRGSTLFLDDFGILVDGAEGVARSFNAIKGSGAFEQLGPAAQKAETIRQALAEMRQQTSRLGVTGKETFFLWSGIKNLIGDGVDKLVLAVAKSKALKDGLTGLANILRGVTDHFEKGGSLGELFFGKFQRDDKGNIKTDAAGNQLRQGVGLFGLGKAAILDLGEALGRGILGGLLKGLSKLPELFEFAWQKIVELGTYLSDNVPGWIEAGLKWLKTEFLPAWENTIKPLTDIIGEGLFILGQKLSELSAAIAEIHTKIVEALAQWMSGFMVGSDGKATKLGELFGVAGPDDPKFVAARQRREQEADQRRRDYELNRDMAGGMAGRAWAGAKFGMSSVFAAFADAIGGYFSGEMWHGLKKMVAGEKAGDSTASGTLAGTLSRAILESTLAATDGGRSIWKLFGDSGSQLLGGGVLGGDTRISPAFDSFKKQFSREASNKKVVPIVPHDVLTFTDAKRHDLMKRLRQISREEDALRRGGGQGVRQEANRRSAQEIRELKEQGYRITPSDERRIRQRNLDEVRRERLKPLTDEREQIQDALRRNAINQAARNRRALATQQVRAEAAAAGGAADLVASSTKQVDLLSQLVGVVASALKELTGASAQLVAVRAAKT